MTKNEIKTFLIDAGFDYRDRPREFSYHSYFFASFECNNAIMLCSDKEGGFTRWYKIEDIDQTMLANECGKYFARIKDHEEKCLLIDLQKDFK